MGPGMFRTIMPAVGGNEKPRPNARAGGRRMARGRSTANDVRGVQPFLASLHFELHHLALSEGLEPVHLDGREVYEHVLAAFLLNEAVALGVIEPLHFSLSHSVCLLQSRTWGAEHPARHRVGRDRFDTRRKGCQETPRSSRPAFVNQAQSIGWRQVQGAVQLPIAQYRAHVAARLLIRDELDE